MTHVAVKISALSNRQPAMRGASSQAGDRHDGGFEALVGRDEKPSEPRASGTERNQPRRPAERNAAAERPEATDRPTESGAAAARSETAAAGGTEGSDTPASTEAVTAAKPAAGPETEAPSVAAVIVPATTVIAPVPAVPVSLEAPAASPADEAAPTLTPADALAARPTDGDAAADPMMAQPQQQLAAAQASAEEAAPADDQPATPMKAKAGKENMEKASAQPDAVVSAVDDDTNAEADAGGSDKQQGAPAPTSANPSRPAHNAQAGTESSTKADDLLATPKLTTDPTAQSMPLMPQAGAHPTAAAHGTQAAPVGPNQTAPVDAIAVDIAAQFKAGNSRFEIRLDPPELGRIDVRLDVDKEGHVTSRLIVERPETFDLLRRDQSSLERALQQAGLKTSDNALEFQLRDQGFAQQQQRDDTPRGIRTLIAETDALPSEAASGYARLLGGRSGVDIRV